MTTKFSFLSSQNAFLSFLCVLQVAKLKSPRRVMLLVKAGAPVDAFIDKLVPLLDKGDIIIDGGNSEYQDSRYIRLKFFWRGRMR